MSHIFRVEHNGFFFEVVAAVLQLLLLSVRLVLSLHQTVSHLDQRREMVLRNDQGWKLLFLIVPLLFELCTIFYWQSWNFNRIVCSLIFGFWMSNPMLHWRCSFFYIKLVLGGFLVAHNYIESWRRIPIISLPRPESREHPCCRPPRSFPCGDCQQCWSTWMGNKNHKHVE